MSLYLILSMVGVALVALIRRTQATNAAATEATRLVARDEGGVRALVTQGQWIAAIKLTRELTGLGLKESKELVEAMQRGEVVTFPERDGSDLDRLLVAAKDPAIRKLIDRGNKIEAIARWRELTGASLTEAKDAIDKLAQAP